MFHKCPNALMGVSSKRYLQSRVTCNGPFVEFPTVSLKKGGQILVNIPQSAFIQVTQPTVSFVKKGLSGLSNRVVITSGSTFTQLNLSMASAVMIDGGAGDWARITVIHTNRSRKWLINGLNGLVAWSRVSLDSDSSSQLAKLEGEGVIALRSGMLGLELSDGQQIQILVNLLLATDAQVAYTEAFCSHDNSLRNNHVVLALKRGIDTLINYFFFRKSIENSIESASESTKETNRLNQLQLSGPGTVILRDS